MTFMTHFHGPSSQEPQVNGFKRINTGIKERESGDESLVYATSWHQRRFRGSKPYRIGRIFVVNFVFKVVPVSNASHGRLLRARDL